MGIQYMGTTYMYRGMPFGLSDVYTNNEKFAMAIMETLYNIFKQLTTSTSEQGLLGENNSTNHSIPSLL
jgi:hypothetical protein